MVALITPTTRPLAPSIGSDGSRRRSDRPELRVIRGGLDRPAVDNSSWYAAGAVAVVILAVVVLRIVQGGPPAPDSANSAVASFAQVAVADVSVGEALVVVAPGDTMWALAKALAPGRDPRPVVDVLADRNGGTALRVGQRVVVPAELVALTGGESSDATLALADRIVRADS